MFLNNNSVEALDYCTLQILQIIYLSLQIIYYHYRQQAPVDKVLFLRGRLAVRYTDSAVLVSSEGGYLRFWSLYANKHELGERFLCF